MKTMLKKMIEMIQESLAPAKGKGIAGMQLIPVCRSMAQVQHKS
jgi:hypothetical protein